MGRLAILSAKGALPVQIAAAHPDALIFTLQGVDHDHQVSTIEHRFEQLGGLMDDLKARGVDQLVFAGAMTRPQLDPTAFDPYMQAIAPKLVQAFQQGDDKLLRFVISLFEEQGIQVRGAHELLPELTLKPGLFVGSEPSDINLKDAQKAAEILRTLGPLDVGQGVVVSAGLCLGIETLQGTDALLSFVAQTPDTLHQTPGVFVKAPKVGQDLRVDMPAIGPQTIENVSKAGLAGIVVAAGRVLFVDKPAILAAAEKYGVFILARDDL
ncbi:UDP-2,3-diacylglucosamine diphosphatase LpxI [Cognatishimia sp. 1_MG-2023]|uniref:LpxI family protein n=1 Tax=Cognatishimia sp. 1_MG-2023 TaxID=3062642 RepID=UPI0026E41C89|nr:UDP-2,3-diacylglucosamine diphosphatase LpxI [Cognatishimia sp. 1_MG-2023]MDO6725498.1 UDP-2,3-diacylglucosamine diphosphatase LpxI [Cognatishimia sp. 1_MG-2023]